MLRAVKISTRAFSATGATVIKPPLGSDKVAPTLEEYNHLDPKGWQIGPGGKLLPRLPEGTKVGSLVMGKYGLYHSERRREAELFREAIENGGQAQSARPIDKLFLRIQYCLAAISVLCSAWCITYLVNGEPIWPYEGYKPPGTL